MPPDCWCCRAASTAMSISRQPSGPGIVMADDFASATRAAAFGGNTFVMPYCLQAKGQPLREALKDYHALAERNCHIDHSFHLIIADPTDSVLGQELPALVADGYTSLKIFMTYADLALTTSNPPGAARWRAKPARWFRSMPRTTTPSGS